MVMFSLTTQMIKRGLMVLSAVGLTGALVFALTPRPVPVDGEAVTRGLLRVTVDEEGKTRIRDVFVVSAPFGGKFLRSPLHVGDYVEKGQTVVAVVEPAPPPLLDVRSQKEGLAAAKAAQATVELATAELKQARSELEFARSDYERAKALRKTRVAAKRTLEEAKMAFETKSARVSRAEANLRLRQRELERAQARLTDSTERLGPGTAVTACCYEVRSPESGQVLKLVAESEQSLNMGTPLVEIGDPRKLEIVVELLSADAVRVKRGARATIEDWGGKPLEARVKRVEPSGFTKVSALGIEEQRVKVILELAGKAEDYERLGHEFRVFAKINTYENKRALRVPIGALFRNDEAWGVFVIKDDYASRRIIEIGQRNMRYAEVGAGLSEGERVILYPSDLISEGISIVQRQSVNTGAK